MMANEWGTRDMTDKVHCDVEAQQPGAADAGIQGLQVDVFLDGGFDIWLHCYFLTGLIQLAESGVIKLSVMRGAVAASLGSQSRNYPLLILSCRRPNGGQKRLICFDPKDQSDAWHVDALDLCDRYFKRSVHGPDVDALPESRRQKVRPINPMFGTWAKGAWGWSGSVSSFYIRLAISRMTSGEAAKPVLRDTLRNISIFSTLSSVDRYEDVPENAKRPQVMFQTRLWDPSAETGDWVESCNQERVEMVQALRAALGDACVGGLVPTPYAQATQPDLISNLTISSRAKRPEFIRLCRQFLVRVNIKALFDAIPYSLGETLAANNCMVSQEVRNACETPFVEGKHYLGFSTPRECAEACRELLDSPQKVKSLREEAHAYYCGAVRPKEAVRTYLKQAMM
jgi:hypothetical protein